MLSMRWLARIASFGFCNISSDLGLISTNSANILSQLVNFVRQILNGSFQFAGVCTTAQQSGQTNNTYQQHFFIFKAPFNSPDV